MASEKLQVQREQDGQVAVVTLDAPPANVLDADMIEALREYLAEAKDDATLKAVLFEATGKHFSYGASVEEHRPDEVREMLPRFHALFRELLDLACPMIAVVGGRCLGGGLELAAACNWIFASPQAQFGLPEIKLGVFPPLGSLLLPLRVPRAWAEDLCLTGRTIDAQEAQRMRLVDDVSDDPAAHARDWIAEHLLPKSASALRFATQAVRRDLRDTLYRHLDALERLYLDELMRTEDAQEGIESFLAKRPPVWKNR